MTLIQTQAACYADDAALTDMWPNTSALTAAERNQLLLRAQSIVDLLVGFHGRRSCPCEGQTTVFPRSSDCCPTTNAGAFDASAGSWPCPAAAWAYWQVATAGTIDGVALTVGQYIVANRAVTVCPAPADAFTVQAAQPDTLACFIPWQVHRATLLLAQLMYLEALNQGQLSTSSSGTTTTTGGNSAGLIGCLNPGDSVKLGDFSYSRGSASVSSSSSISTASSALGTSQLGREVLTLLSDLTSFGLQIC